jgi:hypothetical protein
VIGDEVKGVSGPRLPVAAPVADHIKLFRNGGVIGESVRPFDSARLGGLIITHIFRLGLKPESSKFS